MYIFSAIFITFPLPPLAKGLCLSAKIVAFYSGADNGSAVAFHLCTFGALFLHFYFTINTPAEHFLSVPIDYGHVEQIFKAKNVGKSVSLQQSKHIMLYDLYQA
jgi:hypothetical protein